MGSKRNKEAQKNQEPFIRYSRETKTFRLQI